MRKYSDLQLGISMTATWAQGASLSMGHAIMRTRGLTAFTVWAICNTLSLLFFGWFVKKYPAVKKITQNPAGKAFLIVTLIYMLWFNAKIMAQHISAVTPHGGLIAGAITLAVLMATFRGGFRYAVLSDQWQYLAMVAGLAVVLVLGLKNGTVIPLPSSTGGDLWWGLWVGLGMLVGPFHNATHYQREGYTRSMRPYWIHTAAFGAYMALVGITGTIDYKWSDILTCLIIVAVTTSSQDSAIAAMQYLFGHKRALAICAAAFILWPISRTTQAATIWEWYQTARIFIVLPLIIYYWRWGKSTRQPVRPTF